MVHKNTLQFKQSKSLRVKTQDQDNTTCSLINTNSETYKHKQTQKKQHKNRLTQK